MAQKTLIGGTAYSISGGRTMVNGTIYNIKEGKAKINGASRKISFAPEYYALLYTTGDMCFKTWDTNPDINKTISNIFRVYPNKDYHISYQGYQ